LGVEQWEEDESPDPYAGGPAGIQRSAAEPVGESAPERDRKGVEARADENAIERHLLVQSERGRGIGQGEDRDDVAVDVLAEAGAHDRQDLPPVTPKNLERRWRDLLPGTALG